MSLMFVVYFVALAYVPEKRGWKAVGFAGLGALWVLVITGL